MAMNTLSRHARTPDPREHSELPFRSDCPRCRQARLAGPAPSSDLLSPRTKAGLAAGVVVVATGLPVASAVAKDDGGSQGGSRVLDVTVAGSQDSGETKAGVDAKATVPAVGDVKAGADIKADASPARESSVGVKAEVPIVGSVHGKIEVPAGGGVKADADVSPPPRAGKVQDGAPVPAPPAVDKPARDPAPVAAPPESKAPAKPTVDVPAPAPAAQVAVPAPQPAPALTPAPAAQASTPAPAAASPSGPPAGRPSATVQPGAASSVGSQTSGGALQGHVPQVASGLGVATPQVSAGEPQATPAPSGRTPVLAGLDNLVAMTTAVSGQAQTPGKPGHQQTKPPGAPAAENYVVRDGDTLWGIARKHLGADASDAAVARYVAKLWERNGVSVIKTGTPDLIYPGQRLQL